MANQGGICCARRTEENEVSESNHGVSREHSWPMCVFMTCGLSLCITVDILQYSMPLAFLPSVLEDRGHEPMTIATAIGVYYWTGFLGQLCLTGYMIFKLLTSSGSDSEEVTTVGSVKRQIYYLIAGLGVGAVTLLGQAMHPHCWMHTACRFAQGLAGAFIFFYCFLLSANLFSGKQKTFAMTMSATALNVAEVLGSSLGAWLFDNWGQRSVFFVLGVVSITNQVFLVMIITQIRGNGVQHTPKPDTAQFGFSSHGWERLKRVVGSERLGCAVLLIVMSAIVKASVEEVLPFHADHRWSLTPLEIGNLFSFIAVAYITSALASGHFWERLARRRVLFCAFWLAALGFVAWGLFLIHSVYHHHRALWSGLMLYGVCLGLTHTPAALLLGDAVEQEEGRAKDAVNGIWNTMWEAGGSLGFLLGGLLAEDYARQLRLFATYSGFCVLCAVLMIGLGGMFDERLAKATKGGLVGAEKTYGSMQDVEK